MIKVGEWKKCSEEEPKVEGEYLVLRFYKGELTYGADIHFLPGYGWNITADPKGVIHTEHKIDFTEDAMFVYYWTTVEEVSDNDGETNG